MKSKKKKKVRLSKKKKIAVKKKNLTQTISTIQQVVENFNVIIFIIDMQSIPLKRFSQIGTNLSDHTSDSDEPIILQMKIRYPKVIYGQKIPSFGTPRTTQSAIE